MWFQMRSFSSIFFWISLLFFLFSVWLLRRCSRRSSGSSGSGSSGVDDVGRFTSGSVSVVGSVVVVISVISMTGVVCIVCVVCVVCVIGVVNVVSISVVIIIVSMTSGSITVVCCFSIIIRWFRSGSSGSSRGYLLDLLERGSKCNYPYWWCWCYCERALNITFTCSTPIISLYLPLLTTSSLLAYEWWHNHLPHPSSPNN